MAATPETWSKMKDTRHRLENCWKTDLNWSLYPEALKKVSVLASYLLQAGNIQSLLSHILRS